MIREMAAQEVKIQQAKKAEERKRIIEERAGEFRDPTGLNEGKLYKNQLISF